ncbi:MAG: hypothetical protein HKN94_09355 [Acidimicrobiales bacterium]|nr:hypothetical protein [Acidimicrobiales bacterium]RZV45802.1 MAG: hypothetical protein EX269_08910 [Acidimicrobiales bacterium]
MKFSRRPLFLMLAISMLGSVLTAAPALAATAPAPRASARWVQEAADYATDSFIDPWDFKAANDLELIDRLRFNGVTNARVEQGRWKGTAAPLGQLILLQTWDNLPWGRDGQAHPIDADTYNHLSFRMKATNARRAAAAVSWYDCGKIIVSCQGSTGFRIEEGWQTYDIDLRNRTGGTKDWAGTIQGLILTPTALGADIEIDWIRLYEKKSDGVRYRGYDTNPGAKLIWDKDRNPSNNTADNPNWGVINENGNDAGYINTDGTPPGRYFIYTHSAAGQSGIRRLLINKAPRPFIIKPNQVGGKSYDEVVRGDLWDFNQPSDIGLTRNLSWSMSNGELVGTNTSPDYTDAGFRLALNPNVPIDADRFHRVTARVFFEGDWSLSGQPGGGMNARWVWRTTDGLVRVSEDIVVLPGWNTITLDMTAFSSQKLVEGNHAQAWAGKQIELIRFDPHEDSGRRRFRVDWIKIAEDDRPTNNVYSIAFRDRGYEPNSTAKIYIDRNNDTVGGTLIATVPVKRGKTTVNWSVPADLRGTGEWYVTVEITDRRNMTAANASTGTIQL